MSERGAVLERDLAPFSEGRTVRTPRRPVLESIAPMSMESFDHEGREALPPQEIVAERKRPSGAATALWAGLAGAVTVIALGLGLKAGLDAVTHESAARPVVASTTAPAARGENNEGTPFASQPMVQLAPVFIASQAGTPQSTTAPAAQPVAAPRALVAAVAPSRAAALPREEKAGIEAMAPQASAEISRSGSAVAIAVAGRRAAACAQADDGHGSMPVSVTFAPSGRVTTATVNGGPFAGTSTGSCIARAMRSATVGPFEGGPVTVHGNVSF